MKVFIGRYFTSSEKALDYYDNLSDDLREHQSVYQLSDKFFVLADSTAKKFNKQKEAEE